MGRTYHLNLLIAWGDMIERLKLAEELVLVIRILHDKLDKINVQIPIMIGGATTSRAHTAVKIAPQYKATVVHVNDASRAVTVAGNLLNSDTNEKYTQDIRTEYDALREGYLNRSRDKNFLTIEQARVNKLKLDWNTYTPTKPNFIGTKTQPLCRSALRQTQRSKGSFNCL